MHVDLVVVVKGELAALLEGSAALIVGTPKDVEHLNAVRPENAGLEIREDTGDGCFERKCNHN